MYNHSVRIAHEEDAKRSVSSTLTDCTETSASQRLRVGCEGIYKRSRCCSHAEHGAGGGLRVALDSPLLQLQSHLPSV